jgi:hypothetical protein
VPGERRKAVVRLPPGGGRIASQPHADRVVHVAMAQADRAVDENVGVLRARGCGELGDDLPSLVVDRYIDREAVPKLSRMFALVRAEGDARASRLAFEDEARRDVVEPGCPSPRQTA